MKEAKSERISYNLNLEKKTGPNVVASGQVV